MSETLESTFGEVLLPDESTASSSISTFSAVRLIRTERQAIGNAIDELRSGKIGSSVSRHALIAAISASDYPMNKDAEEFKSGYRKLFPISVPVAEGTQKWTLNADLAEKFYIDAILILELSLSALQSAELSAVALFKTGQPIPAAWGNLHPVELAKKITERAVAYYRGRLFE